MKRQNPIVKRVINKFETIEAVATKFLTGDMAQRGMLISGDAGTGKSHYIMKAFIDTDTTSRVSYYKSENFTPPALYTILWKNRRKGDVIVFDDCALEGLTGQGFQNLVGWLKGGLDISKDKNKKMIGYRAATKNALFEEEGVEPQFAFEGSIIWITNSSFEKLSKKFGEHWDAIQTRFIPVPVKLTREEKYMYTQYLISELDILGEKCEAKEGGYSDEVIDNTIEYLSENYESLREVTPRVAIKVADTMSVYPDMWETILGNQNLY